MNFCFFFNKFAHQKKKAQMHFSVTNEGKLTKNN